MEYIIQNDTIIFKPEFNNVFDEYIEILVGIKKIYFTDSRLDKIFLDCDLILHENWSSEYNLNCIFNHGYSRFNKSVDNLPSNITHIFFSGYFDKPVDNLPSDLTHLFFGHEFSQPVDNLPIHLTYLIFNFSFNYPVDNLPLTLKVLTFGYKFSQPVDNLPPFLTYLIFGDNFNMSINWLPHSIKVLVLGMYFTHPLDNLPNGIQSIKFIQPNEFQQLRFDDTEKYIENSNCLPNSVEEIQLPFLYDKCIEKIPSKLKKIICDEKYKFIDLMKDIGIEVSTCTIKY